MDKFIFKKSNIEGLYEIEPKVFADKRGFFLETYNYKYFAKAGLDMKFVQDNQSSSKRGVLRGLHFQTKNPQGKLVRVIKGEVFDVAVDMRKGSKTFGQWHGVLLSSEKKNMFYIPEGFAHGFLVISEETEFIYKCTDYYYPEYESGVIWNDETISINWPIPRDMEIILSDKDKQLSKFNDLKECL
ncbi:MAG TPA: dTDP-4-dehydrorhamnose 3,5-epimerase [Clostridiales bacterium]|nr:dTDP-4-dehydrorhamnose 3,5-epimerase [Clostridiales bacterium]